MREWTLGKYRIKIIDSVVRVIESYIQDTKDKHESGGILLGQVKERNIYILNASTPNKFDKAGRYYFERNMEIAQIIVNYEFMNSNQKTIYLGEWHTHPVKIPSPSVKDRIMIKNQYNKNILNESYVLLIIQGLKGIYVGLFDGKKITDGKEDNYRG